MKSRVGGAIVARCEEAQGFWVCPKEGEESPMDRGLFIEEVNMGSRLEHIFLKQV